MERAWRAVVLLGALVSAWLFVDLYFRIDLPLAATAIHLAFRAAAAGVAWMDGGGGHRPEIVLAVAAGLVAIALVPGRWTAPMRSLGGLPLAAGQVALVVVAALMERGLFAGILVGGLLGARALAKRDPTPAPEADAGRRFTVLRALLGLGTAALALYFLSELLAARSDGYLVDRMSGSAAWRFAVLPLILACGGLATLRTRRTSDHAAAGGAVALLVGLLLDPGLPLVSALLAGAAGSLVLAALWAPLVARPAPRRWDPATWPGRLAPLVLVALLLIAHSYSERVFGCGAVDAPSLTRLAEPGEVFRTAVSDDGVVALSLRSERRFGRLTLRPEPGRLGYAEPGPVPARPDALPPGTTLASTEELLWAPSADAFFGTVLGGHPDFYSLPSSPPNVVNNLIVRLAPDGARVDEAVGIEHLCWIGAMAWQDDDQRLYLGCEYEPALHRYDPATGAIEATVDDAALGDVAAIAVDPRPGSDRLFTVSFWNSQAVVELSRSGLEVRRRRDVGGAHYDVAYDPGSDRLFLSSYYGSRVRILDGGDLGRVGRVATGLGTRALAVDPARDVVLASSVYDGALTVARGSTGRRLERLQVGGHVKDIAVDSDQGLAWFASRCGLFELDLDRLTEGGRP